MAAYIDEDGDEYIYPYSTIEEAAGIIGDFLDACEKPTAIYFDWERRRFTVAGSGYSPSKTQELIGVYMPDVAIKTLVEDFMSIMIEGRVME